MTETGFDQSVEVLKRTERDYRAKCTEVDALRHRLADCQLELDRTKSELRKSEIRVDSLLRDNEKKQIGLDVVVKELAAKKQIVENVTAENARLRRDVESSSRHTGEAYTALKAKTAANGDLLREADAPAALYLNHCFSIGIDPSLELLRSLFSLTTLSATKTPASYQQLFALCEVFRLRSTVCSDGWPRFDAIDIACETQEGFHLVSELVPLLPHLRSVRLVGLGDEAAVEFAGVLAVADRVEALSLPQLAVADLGFSALLKVVVARERLAASSGGAQPLLAVESLDLSRCQLQDLNTFHLIRGQCLGAIDLSGLAALRDPQFGEVLASCPALTSLSVARCASLTNDAVLFINAAPNLLIVDICGCAGISVVRLSKVERLSTDLKGVVHFDCPALRAIPTPVSAFQCVTWVTPQLTELTFHGASLQARELGLLSESATMLTHLTFFRCRLQSLEVFLRRMRRLRRFALHGCTGVSDADLLTVCSTVEALDLTDCYSLTDKAVAHVAQTCVELRELTLKRCSNVTDAGVTALESCQRLTYLNALGMRKATVLALHRLLSHLPSLTHLVHESLITATIRVDRADDEEATRAGLVAEERALSERRDRAGLAYSLSVSPSKAHASAGGLGPAAGSPQRDNRSASPQAAVAPATAADSIAAA